MKAALHRLFPGGREEWHPHSDLLDPSAVQLVLCFGARSCLQDGGVFTRYRERYPRAILVSCSTAGEIFGNGVSDQTVVCAALQFSQTSLAAHEVHITDMAASYEAGRDLVNQFDKRTLRHLLVFSDGNRVNGSELVRGMNEACPPGLLITGGLAGDGTDFRSTLVGLNQPPRPGQVVAIGFYGSAIKITHGSRGGWETFGPERRVTRSLSNLVFEIEGRNALEVYKRYLGPEAEALPGSALLFPLAVKLQPGDEPVVRTILSIDEASGAMIFAGDIPEGSLVRFMKANFDKLTLAAAEAAQQTSLRSDGPPRLALLISCVGRKMILQSRTEEELEAVEEIYGPQCLLTGFYSYGEISPFTGDVNCRLHNQTMTITTFDEPE